MTSTTHEVLKGIEALHLENEAEFINLFDKVSASDYDSAIGILCDFEHGRQFSEGEQQAVNLINEFMSLED